MAHSYRLAWLLIAAAALVSVGALRIHGQTWIPLVAPGQQPDPGGGLPVAYNASSNRLIRFSGSVDNGFNFSADVWLLTNADGLGGVPAWSKLAARGTPPPGRNNSVIAYDESTNRLMLFSGCSDNCRTLFNDVWVLTNADGTGGFSRWMPISPSAISHPPALTPLASTILALID
jgi:hypothetical protein